jgi:hypothetical protein
MRYLLLVSVAVIASCSSPHTFKKDKALFNASAVQLSFKSVADMNDSYFVIKENNFFEFYRQLFDSVKNSMYAGKYTKKGDTLLLHFYNKKGAALLGSKALIVEGKKQVIFFK